MRDPDELELSGSSDDESDRTAPTSTAGVLTEADCCILALGTHWNFKGELVEVQGFCSFNDILIRKSVSGECHQVNRNELTPIANTLTPTATQNLNQADEQDIARAQAIESALVPYVAVPLSAAEKKNLALRFSVDPRTIVTWLSKYRKEQHFSAFLRNKPGCRRGVTKLPDAVEAIVRRAIKDHWEAHHDITVEAIYDRIEAHCNAIKTPVPARSTLLDRVNKSKADHENYPSDLRSEIVRRKTVAKELPEPTKPLELVQVDHTPIDMPVDDPITGKCIGVPFITVLIDVLTRVILGFCLTLEAPSRLSTALALHHAVFPKEQWLEKIGAVGPWPFYGLMKMLHMDHAMEFVSAFHRRALKRWHIHPGYRRLAAKEDGAWIERYLGTLNSRIHVLPGATKHRSFKKPSKTSAHFTLATLETWIANEITAYHHEQHSSLGMAPAHAWERAWTTDKGITFPIYPKDERDFLISFLPGVHRTITREGVSWKRLNYRCDELRSYIETNKCHTFRFDPRDISRLYFEVPEGGHIDVPWTHLNFPPMSVWEWDETRPLLRIQPRSIDGYTLHRAREANRELIKKQASTKQRSRRRLAREEAWRKAGMSPPEPPPAAPLLPSTTSISSEIPFEVLE